jgi:hypothetical protein
VFGTKMRSVVKLADKGGILRLVEQQFEVGQQIFEAGLMPILEPEVDIHSPQKQEAEHLLHRSITKHLEQLPGDHQVMLKLTIPSEDSLYRPLIEHPRVLRVVALSGGYSGDEANERLARNPGLIASFSRALIGELSADQSDAEFDKTLDTAWRASTGHQSPDDRHRHLRVPAARQRTQGAVSCTSVRSRQLVEYARLSPAAVRRHHRADVRSVETAHLAHNASDGPAHVDHR